MLAGNRRTTKGACIVRIRTIFTWLIILLCPAAVYADKAARLNKDGIDAYVNENHEESVQYFTEALVDRPESPELRFNRGTALSAAGRNDEAVRELDRAAEIFEQRDLAAAAHYNAGNTYFKAGNLEDAIEEYKRAVKLDQSSKDIRHNLELALRMLDQQQKQQQQKNEQNQENRDQQDESQNASDRESEHKGNEQQNQARPREEQKQDQQENQNRPQQESEQQPMTPEEAQRILDAMNGEEKEAFDLRKMMMKETMRQSDDW